jgi:hypothetical protein
VTLGPTVTSRSESVGVQAARRALKLRKGPPSEPTNRLRRLSRDVVSEC